MIIAIILIACNQEDKHLIFTQNKADKFIQNHRTDFLNDSELLKYDYNPRAQFGYNHDSTNIYRVFSRENEIRLICYSDSCELNEPFTKYPLILIKGSYTIKKDSIFSDSSHNPSIVELHSFEQNPEEYFIRLKKRLNKYGVFAFYGTQDKSVIKVYLSAQYYLIHSKEIQKYTDKDEVLKSYDDNWYFVKMKRPMDLG